MGAFCDWRMKEVHVIITCSITWYGCHRFHVVTGREILAEDRRGFHALVSGIIGASQRGYRQRAVRGRREEGIRLLAFFDGEPHHLNSPVKAGQKALSSETQRLSQRQSHIVVLPCNRHRLNLLVSFSQKEKVMQEFESKSSSLKKLQIWNVS